MQNSRIWTENPILYLLTKSDSLKVSMHLLNANGSERIRCFCGLKDLTLFNFLCSNLTRTKKFTDVSRWYKIHENDMRRISLLYETYDFRCLNIFNSFLSYVRKMHSWKKTLNRLFAFQFVYHSSDSMLIYNIKMSNFKT